MFCQEEWDAIDLNYIRSLYRSLPSRIQELREAKGKWTKY